jgi:signal transduction histidine kinase
VRPKRFLTFVLLCAVPCVLISAFVSFYNVSNSRAWLREDLRRELDSGKYNVERIVLQRQRELATIAENSSLRQYLDKQRISDDHSARLWDKSLIDSVAPLLINRSSYSSLTCFDLEQHSVFSVLRSDTDPLHLVVNSQPELQQSDKVQRGGKQDGCTVVSSPTGKMLRCFTWITAEKEQVGTLIGDINLDSLVADAAWPIDGPNQNNATPYSDTVVAVDDSGEIVYHTNNAFIYQAVANALPEFQPIAQAMASGATGEGLYRSLQGDDWLAAYAPVVPPHLSLAITKNYSLATRPIRRMGWFSIVVALVLGFGTATILSFLYERRRRTIERVTRGVTAIAEGDLDTQIEALSRGDMRELARGVNAVTNRLREQVARETETRQIEAFVRLSAMLTHDLKNTINGLSIYVGNLEKQFDSPTFRVESMEALTDATQRLQSLVDRLSNPVVILSGEYKRPSLIDLVPLVRDVVTRTIGSGGTKHEIEMLLPDTLIALVDGERIETVVENLLLNSLEAMSEKPGKVTIAGARQESGEIVLTVTDTGVGMSQNFIEQKLFHPFATTKKKGMGLGVYTCREVIKANGGSIEVSSEPGLGTTFRVVLPSPPSDKAEA